MSQWVSENLILSLITRFIARKSGFDNRKAHYMSFRTNRKAPDNAGFINFKDLKRGLFADGHLTQ